MVKHIYAIGELLIDFVCTDTNVHLSKGENFLKKAGGAPANVCAAVCNLGGKSSFIGKVGDEPFGDFLVNQLDLCGVDTSLIMRDTERSTTMAFVSLFDDGQRDFYFNRGADSRLKFTEIDSSIFSKDALFHFGSATGFLPGELYETYRKTLHEAGKKGCFISFDPNYRVDLWRGKEKEFIAASKSFLSQADLAKFSDEELELITGESELEKAIHRVHELGTKYVAVTLGSQGSLFSNKSEVVKVPSINVEAIDSTGAGDAFVGALLYLLTQENDIDKSLSRLEKIKELVAFANVTAALVCTKYGAMAALPRRNEVESYIPQKYV